MKRTIIDTCALTSFVLVVALGASAISIHLTRESRIKENREWMEKVIKEQVKSADNTFNATSDRTCTQWNQIQKIR